MPAQLDACRCCEPHKGAPSGCWHIRAGHRVAAAVNERGTPNPWSHDYLPREQHEYMLELVKRDHGGSLPEWAIAADLVYLADLAQHPTKPQAFPGRRRLEARWGVSERIARRCLASPGWQLKCDLAGVKLPERKTDGPMGERPRSRTTTVPGSVPTLSPVVSPVPTEEAPESGEPVPGGVPGGVPGPVPPPSPPTSTRAEIGPTVLRSPEEQHHDVHPVEPAPAPSPAARPTRRPKTSGRTTGETQALAPLVAAWDLERLARKAAGFTIGMSRHLPAEDPRWDAASALLGSGRLTTTAALDLIAWAFRAPGFAPELFRGERPGQNGRAEVNQYLDPPHLFADGRDADGGSKLAKKLASAEAWVDSGRRSAASSNEQRAPPSTRPIPIPEVVIRPPPTRQEPTP